VKTATKVVARKRRQARVRKKVVGTESRPRLAVFRSNRHIYAQVIDDVTGRTMAAASTLDQGAAGGTKAEAAKRVGERVAQRAKQAGIASVAFDRGGYLFHGRVREVAEGARSAGLEF